MNHQITIPAYAQPVSLDEMKLHLKVDSTADDELIRSLIASATQWAEAYEGQAYMARTCTYKLDAFKDTMHLPVNPVQSVSSIQYIDDAGTTQTLATTYYDVFTGRIPCEVRIGYNDTWPSTRDTHDAVTITFVAGHATTFTASGATLTVKNALFANGDLVRITTDQGDLPAGLSADTDYYVVSVSGSTLGLSLTSGGAAVTTTDAGTGTHYIAKANPGLVPDRVKAAIKLLVGHWYEHREDVSETALTQIPSAATSLLFERVWRL